MRYQVKVTQEDIDLGTPKIGTSCPVARAIKRETPFKKVHVALQYWYKDYDTDWLNIDKRINLPTRITQFIEDFDSGRQVKPFLFELDTEGKLYE